MAYSVPLHVEVFNTIEDRDCNLESIGREIGSTKQELSNYRKSGKLGFRKILRLSYLLHPGRQSEVMSNWCLRLTTTEAIKQAFEYASITRNIELLRKLLTQNKNETGVLKKCVRIYSILYDFYTNKIKASDIKHRLNKIGNIDDPDLGVLMKIIKCYYLFYYQKYGYILELAREAEEELSNLNKRHKFLIECFLHRLAEILGNVSLYFNDLFSARYYSSLIINANICAKTVSDAYYIVGMTYLTENKDKCIDMLTARYNMTKVLGEGDLIENARRDLDLAKVYLGYELDNDSDIFLKKLQNNQSNRFELRDVKQAIYHHGDDDFFVLIEAMSLSKTEALYKCRKKFAEELNYFFASVTAKEIKKCSEGGRALDELIDAKIKTKGGIEFEEDFIKCFTHYYNYNRSVTA